MHPTEDMRKYIDMTEAKIKEFFASMAPAQQAAQPIPQGSQPPAAQPAVQSPMNPISPQPTAQPNIRTDILAQLQKTPNDPDAVVTALKSKWPTISSDTVRRLM